MVMEEVKKFGSVIVKILVYGLFRSVYVICYDEVEMVMEEGLMEIIFYLECRINYIVVFVNIVILLGLFGIIMGLINVFIVVVSVDLL